MPVITNPRPNPYPGPRPFRRDQKLYGRDRESWELTNLLIAERIVLLYSPSGAGKTSLIQSALIPELEREGFRVLPPMRTGLAGAGPLPDSGNPFTLNLLQSLELGLPADRRSQPAQLATLTFQAYLEERVGPRPADRCGDVLVFDQFEEIFTNAGPNSQHLAQFFDDIGQVLRDPSRWALFSMREEFIAGLDPYVRQLPTRLVTRYRLELLLRKNALQAIREPARAAGVEYSDAAADKLVSDLLRVSTRNLATQTSISTADHVEPVHLQVACRRLWQQLRPDQVLIEEEDVKAYGNVDQALTDFYEDTIHDLVQGAAAQFGERKLRRWFEHELITPASTRGLVYRGEADTAGLPNQAIESLNAAHIVREVVRGNDIWYELAHDRLVPPILAANRRWEATYYNPLAEPTRVWINAQRDRGKLLRGSALEQAIAYQRDRPKDILEDEATFLRESREADEARRKEEEARRLEERAAAQRRRRLIAFGVIAAGVIIALGLALLYIAQARNDARRLAEAQQALAKAGTLAGGALEELAQPVPDPSKALIMALEAVGTTWQGDRPFVTPLANKALVDSAAMAPPWVSTLPHQRHVDEIYSAAFSPDGSRILTASKDGTAKLWDANSGRPLATLIGHKDEVRTAAFSPDGRQAVTAGDDGAAMVWSLPAGANGEGVVLEPELVVEGHLARLRSASFSPDGKHLLTASDDGTARLWDAANGQEEATLEEGPCRVLWAGHSPSGDRIVTSGLATSEDGTGCGIAGVVKIWDSRTREELVRITEHTDWVRSAVFSPDGKRLLTASDDSTARVWDTDTGRELVRLEIPDFWISSAAFSPDGDLIATVTTNLGDKGQFEHSITVWDAASGAELGQAGAGTYPRPHFDRIWSVAFSPDGARLLTASSDETAKVWELDRASPGSQVTIREVPVIDGHASWIRQASFSRDGTRIVSAGDDHRVRIWDAASGEEVTTLVGHTGWVNSALFSADGSRVLSSSSDGTARIWDAATGQVLVRLFHDVRLFSAAFSPGERHVVTAGNDGNVRVWDLSGGGQRVVLVFAASQGPARSARYSPDGRRIVAAGSNGALGIWDAASGELLLPLEGHDPTVTVYWATYNPAGTLVASASEDGTARIWDASTGQPVHILEGHAAGVMAAVFSPDGKQLVTAGRDNLVLVWDVQSGVELRPLAGHIGEVRSAAYSPDGQFIITAGGDGDNTMRVWRTRSPVNLVMLDAPTEPVLKSTLFSPDGTLLVTAANRNFPVDFSARIWDASTGKQIGEPLQHSDWVNYAAFSPDGSQVVTAVDDGTAIVWDVNTGQKLRTLSGRHKLRLASATFSPDGRQILTASWDGTAQAWDAKTGQPLPLLLRHVSGINAATYSRDGDRIITASNDRTAKIWDAATGEELAELVGHKDRVNAADLSPDGRLAVTGGDDSTAIVWDASQGTRLFSLQGHGDAVVSAAFSPDGSRILTASKDGLAKIWNAETGEELFTPAWVDQSILFAAFHPDGTAIVSDNLYSTRTSARYTVRVWPSTIDALLEAAEQLIQREPPVLTLDERRKLGLQPAQGSP